ncbi:MAG: 4Fe-4S cluster-binding domain-containing protein [Chloroflexi bacterium]|nr:4Fe-4S cluster-binding domain-containing protein [Chloroflexota bacterium]
MLPPQQVQSGARRVAGGEWVRVHGLYHDSLIEGSGRRSCVLLSGCDRDCTGCWVPHLHAVESGTIVPVDLLADALLDPAHQRDGVSVLGGEPLAQPEGLAALVRTLRDRACLHTLVYTGYTYETLRPMVEHVPAIGAVLDEIDVLIDGPYVEALAEAPAHGPAPATSGYQPVGEPTGRPGSAGGHSWSSS